MRVARDRILRYDSSGDAEAVIAMFREILPGGSHAASTPEAEWQKGTTAKGAWELLMPHQCKCYFKGHMARADFCGLGGGVQQVLSARG